MLYVSGTIKLFFNRAYYFRERGWGGGGGAQNHLVGDPYLHHPRNLIFCPLIHCVIIKSRRGCNVSLVLCWCIIQVDDLRQKYAPMEVDP